MCYASIFTTNNSYLRILMCEYYKYSYYCHPHFLPTFKMPIYRWSLGKNNFQPRALHMSSAHTFLYPIFICAMPLYLLLIILTSEHLFVSTMKVGYINV